MDYCLLADFDIFGDLPGTFEDHWTESVERLEAMMGQFIQLHQNARGRIRT
jgi:hypothetical protein